ncbi:metallophosphoesterase family protein [Halapricum hydrolyticum]|uniref:Phosphoesterase n=1 Tax=Halapricum hydrolyticum TaxID=2979991 RepID=A0AAE3IA76_9EURY|nr:metallophosphoesterase family protein [Halapricum hydrolyticum]MCU4717562.1 metallophosphatase family protein [Halapricum hydrolyticum]MCU4726726.1 metallophosphatase family protein [Halapricum hydrolyticum]
MQIGVISDVHGNIVALDAVLSDMPEVDELVCAGDVVGYNPWPGECVDRIRDADIPTVEGNHDRAVVTGKYPGFNDMAAAGVEYAREHLTEEQIEWLAELPTERTLFDGRVKIVHGHPDDPDHYTRPSEFSPELLGDEDVLIMGHTHVQHHEIYDEGIVLNPGSVGQPRDRDHRAAYSVIDPDARTVAEHRVEYDTDAVVHEVVDAGLPQQIGFRLTQGR